MKLYQSKRLSSLLLLEYLLCLITWLTPNYVVVWHPLTASCLVIVICISFVGAGGVCLDVFQKLFLRCCNISSSLFLLMILFMKLYQEFSSFLSFSRLTRQVLHAWLSLQPSLVKKTMPRWWRDRFTSYPSWWRWCFSSSSHTEFQVTQRELQKQMLAKETPNFTPSHLWLHIICSSFTWGRCFLTLNPVVT